LPFARVPKGRDANEEGGVKTAIGGGDGGMGAKMGPQPRLPIPVFRNLFFGSKKPFLTEFLRISFFLCLFRRNFSQERGFEEVAGIPVFFLFYRNFSQEFLWAGFPVFTQDSSGILEDSCSRPKLSGSVQRLKKALC
jgi:hypothetical protein